MSYLVALSHVSLLDPHMWTESTLWTTASDSYEARRTVSTHDDADSDIVEWIVGAVCVLLLLGAVALALRTSHGERPDRDRPRRQHYPPRPPAPVRRGPRGADQ